MPRTEFDGFDDFADDLESFADDLDRAADRIDRGGAVDRGVEETARTIEIDASQRAPVDTGELRESGYIEKQDDGSWLVIFGADHAKPVEYGTRPYVITPNEADVLRFEVDGEIVFATRVEHPGQAPSPYLRPALDTHRRDLPSNILDEIKQVVADELA